MSKTPKYLGTTLKSWQKMLTDDDPLQRRLAAYALGQLGEEAKPAVPDLLNALKDEEDYVRVWAAASLAIIEPGNKKAFKALVDGLKEDRNFVRSLAAWHLSRLHCEAVSNVTAAFPELEKLRHDEDRSVQVEAEIAWKRIHSRLHLTHQSAEEH